MLIVTLLIIAKKMKINIGKINHPYTTEYYSAIQRNEMFDVIIQSLKRNKVMT